MLQKLSFAQLGHPREGDGMCECDSQGEWNARPAAAADLLGDGGELHDVQRLVVGGGALVDVDDHGRSASAAEGCLEEFGQLALSERDVAALCSDGRMDKWR